MFKKVRRWATALGVGTMLMYGGATCDSGLGGAEYIADDYSYSGEGDYYYGWYEDNGSSFSLTPGSDPGDSLETYLGNFVTYP
jgi:hypothetical protein